MRNIQSILVPTDFSDAANNSLEYAIELARRTDGSRLLVMHSFHVPVTTMETTYVADQAILMEQTETRAKEEMRALELKYLQAAGIPYECSVRLGPAMENINEIVKEQKVDLVLMATHKASKLERIIGTLSAYAIEHCKAPLLLVPDQAQFKPIRKLAFATDLKRIKRSDALEKVKDLAVSFQAQVIILNVHTGDKPLKEKEEAELIHLQEELKGCDYQVELLVGDDPEEAILEYVQQEGVELVAAVPRHHGFFEELFSSSTTKQLALHTRVPLLAIHE